MANKLLQTILAQRPVLNKVLEQHGSKSLFQYATEYFQAAPRVDQTRQEEFINTLTEIVQRKFDQTIAQTVRQQLHRQYLVSTVDHHGPIMHPFFLGSNLVWAMASLAQNNPDLKNLIVLSCGNVSMNNSSFPRGLLYGRNRLSLLPSKYNHLPVCVAPSYGQSTINRLQRLEIWPKLQTIYGDQTVLELPRYAEQISRTNYLFWQQLGAEYKIHLPELLYIQLEQVVTELLIKHHFHQPTLLNQLLFDNAQQLSFEQLFDGIPSGFDLTKRTGSYLFWAIPKQTNHRLQLWRQGRELVSVNGQYRISLQPEALENALASGELIPGMLLGLVVISLYYGVTCLGGFSQIDYLAQIKQAYEHWTQDSVNQLTSQPITDKFAEAFVIGSENGRPAQGLDMLINSQQTSWLDLVNVAKTKQLRAVLEELLPEIAKIIN